MGMFDDVTGITLACRKCGEPISGWQTKSGPMMLITLPIEQLALMAIADHTVNFYESCRHCGAWNEYRIDPQFGSSSARKTISSTLLHEDHEFGPILRVDLPPMIRFILKPHRDAQLEKEDEAAGDE